jgi:Dyp-type peroxidase family
MQEILRQFAELPADGREPFGYADGISQPIIAGTDRDKKTRRDNAREHALHSIKAGEFILGYPDGTGNLPRSPALSPAVDVSGFLKPHGEWPELRDFGRNGSFLVVRQLAQDVEGFKSFVSKNSKDDFDLGAKMVGRTKDGATLTTDTDAKNDNDFDYLQDLEGKGCPIGAHVRRTNPRSTVHASSNESSLQVTNRHRIIRRGRIYKNEDGETGLMFLCLNASINRQFEFIQSTWCDDPFFQGLSGEVDPLIGTQSESANHFTAPDCPYRHKVKGLKQWVTVKGGGYFFLPGLAALKVLSEA